MRYLINRLLAVALLAVSFSATDVRSESPPPAERSIKGKDEFKLKPEIGGFIVTGGGALDGTHLSLRSGIVSLARGDAVIASAPVNSAAQLVISDGAGKQLFTIAESGDSYRVLSADGTLAARVKMKEDKFNVYGPDDKRVYHGKQKEDGFKVIDESDALAWKIKGTSSFRESSVFALPIDIAARIVLWGSWYGVKPAR